MAIAVSRLIRSLPLLIPLLAGLTGSPHPSRAQTPVVANDTPPPRRLRVGIKTLPPFVINRPIELSSQADPQSRAVKKRLEFVGIDIAIWEAIATAQKWDYDYLEYATVDDGLADLAKGDLDIVLGGLEITPERLTEVNFTQPYYFSHAALLMRRPPLPLWNYLHPFLKFAVVGGIALVFISISLFSHLIWLAERRHNSENFPLPYWPGISQAYWFTAVTMTTVGYGDTVPITGMGRRLTFIWMWIGMVLSSSITAALASGFTLSVTQQLNEGNLQAQDLNQKIAVIGDALNLTFLREQPVPLVSVESFNDAVTLLNDNQVEGILYFEDALAYFQQRQASQRYELINLDSVPIAYGFAVKLDDPLLKEININLLELMRSQQLQSIINQYSPGNNDG